LLCLNVVTLNLFLLAMSPVLAGTMSKSSHCFWKWEHLHVHKCTKIYYTSGVCWIWMADQMKKKLYVQMLLTGFDVLSSWLCGIELP
jgi:hypothetical protein